jgi:hypothetical protein
VADTILPGATRWKLFSEPTSRINVGNNVPHYRTALSAACIETEPEVDTLDG